MSRPRPLTRVALVATSAVVPVLLLSGCASNVTEAGSGSAAPTATAASGYPLTLDNCGTSVTVAAAPTRILTVKSSTTELLLALGLGEKIVGSAFLDGPLPDALTAQHGGATLNVVSDFLPSQEAALALTPDFIYGGWESNFSADGVGERDQLAGMGVGSYVSPAACKEDGYAPDPLTFDTVFAEITEAGAIFGAPEAAAELVTSQQAELDALVPAADAPTALWYSSGTDTPYVGAGIGSPEMIMSAAGLTNIFADVHDSWTSVGWESIVEADPSVIVLVDASWNTAASKIATLETSPATQGLSAVKSKRYIVLPFASTEAGTRNVEAAASIVEQLAGFGGK